MSDEVKNPELKVVNSKKNQEKKVTTDIDAGVEQAPPSTIYHAKMATMTPIIMASMGVQLIQVNGEELFWVTSTGQLYSFNAKQAALEAEYTWLMSKPN